MTASPEYFAHTGQEASLAQGRWESPRRVLAISASHRGKRGVSHQLCAALTQGMEQAGAQVDTVVLADLKFSPCRGCFQCWGKTWQRCFHQDDLAPLLDSLPGYDLMLWAMPLYVDGMPGLLKNLVDRMMILNHPAILDQGQRCVHPCRHPRMPFLAALGVCGFWGRENFAPLRSHLEALAQDQHTPLVAFLERPESLSLLLPSTREAMARVRAALTAAGNQLVESGRVSAELEEEIARPLLLREEYLELGSRWWTKA